jgi:dihydroneopterin aldolase
MSQISVVDFEVFFHVGVPDEERRSAQRLLLTTEMEVDFSAAALGDDLRQTIDYFAVSQDMQRFGDGRSWSLIETLAVELARHILKKYGPISVAVEVKKFIIPQARWVSVRHAESTRTGC